MDKVVEQYLGWFNEDSRPQNNDQDRKTFRHILSDGKEFRLSSKGPASMQVSTSKIDFVYPLSGEEREGASKIFESSMLISYEFVKNAKEVVRNGEKMFVA